MTTANRPATPRDLNYADAYGFWSGYLGEPYVPHYATYNAEVSKAFEAGWQRGHNKAVAEGRIAR